jgi:hypothetical protein
MRNESAQVLGDDREPTTDRPRDPNDVHREQRDAGVLPREIGGPKGLEPTRYGDWERAGRCIDF